VLGNIGGPGFLILILLAVFLWGPDKIPYAIANLRRFIAKARQMASNAANDLSKEVGVEIKPEDLNPKTFVRKHVLSAEDQELLTNPLKATLKDLEDGTKPLKEDLNSVTRDIEDTRRRVNGHGPSGAGSTASDTGTAGSDSGATAADSGGATRDADAGSRYDDAT
jgi:sec-independent protein translocase protein TatB